jgi:hypothetical protein
MFPFFQVFLHLAECHLNIMRRNSEEFSLIQIGRALSGFQAEFAV